MAHTPFDRSKSLNKRTFRAGDLFFFQDGGEAPAQTFKILGAGVADGRRDILEVVLSHNGSGSAAGWSAQYKVSGTSTWNNLTISNVSAAETNRALLTFTQSVNAEYDFRVSYDSGPGNWTMPGVGALESVTNLVAVNQMLPLWTSVIADFQINTGTITPVEMAPNTDQGNGLYTFSIGSGALPGNLSISPQGQISGDAVSTGDFFVQIKAEIMGREALSNQFRIRVEQPPLFIGPDIEQITVTENEDIQPVGTSQRFTSTQPMTYAKAGTSWPAWLNLDTITGLITGKAPAGDAQTLGHRVQALNALGNALSNAFNVLVFEVGNDRFIDADGDHLVDADGDNLIGM